MSRERPMLFSGPMVRAILDGAKTQTRRVIQGQAVTAGPTHFPMFGLGWENDASVIAEWRELIHCPFGVPGDRLWVRESFCENYFSDAQPGTLKHGYRADWNRERMHGIAPEPRWTPSIHMPRWASRITLEITDVRVERLNAISEDDARAEGMRPVCPSCGNPLPERVADSCAYCEGGLLAKEAFAMLWTTINAKSAPWSSNPWVWALTFRRLP